MVLLLAVSDPEHRSVRTDGFTSVSVVVVDLTPGLMFLVSKGGLVTIRRLEFRCVSKT